MLVQHTDAPRKLVSHSVAALHQHGLAASQILRHTAAAGRQHGASASHRLHGHKARGLLHQRGHAAQVGQAVIVGQVLIGDVARELYAVAQTLGLLLQFALERALLGAGEEGAAHDQQLDVRLMQRGNSLHQLMDALVRVEPPTVEHDEILVGKAELRAQRFGCRAGAETGRVNAVVQNVGPLRVKSAGLQVILADEIAQRQHAAVDVVHHGGTGRLAVQVRQTAFAAKHAADGAALGQVSALGHDQVGRRQLQCQRELNLLVPRVIGRGDPGAPLQKDHRPVAAVAARAVDVEHLRMLPALGGAAGGIVGDTGAQQIKLPLLLVLADQMGQQRLHRAALHRGDRQIRRRHQQHAGTSFLV